MTAHRALALALLTLLAACSSSEAQNPPPATPVCGNGAVETGETCDEGAANGTPGGHCKADCSGLPAQVSVEGDVFAFLSEVNGPRLQDVKVSLLEHPELSVDAGVDAHFRFDGLWEGDDVTLVAEQSTIQTTQTATVKLGAHGIDPFSVQVVPTTLFTALSGLVPQPPELDKYCAIATTVARMGGSLFAHQRQGMDGVTVSLDPPVDPSSGPIYFNSSVLPDTSIHATTVDGGVLFYRLAPGNYVLKAAKDGIVFNTVRVNCRAGVITNAGPPLGLLANVVAPDFGLGSTRADDAYSASSDALCTQTASCVNSQGAPGDYPAATLASCKANFRDVWAFVDPGCDPNHALQDAAKTFFDCRSASCATALGDDTVCATEDAAFRAAEATYGACLSAKP